MENLKQLIKVIDVTKSGLGIVGVGALTYVVVKELKGK